MSMYMHLTNMQTLSKIHEKLIFLLTKEKNLDVTVMGRFSINLLTNVYILMIKSQKLKTSTIT